MDLKNKYFELIYQHHENKTNNKKEHHFPQGYFAEQHLCVLLTVLFLCGDL